MQQADKLCHFLLQFMNPFKILITSLAMFIGITSSFAKDTNIPDIVICKSDWDLGSSRAGPEIITALWSDGRIVWSATNAGAPLLRGRFAPEKLTALLDGLENKGTFTNKMLARPYFGPDSAFLTISIDDGRRRLRMLSWHEPFEENTNLVATVNGIEPLSGRNRKEVLEHQPVEYQNFRRVWSDIRKKVAALIPQKGVPYSGAAKFRPSDKPKEPGPN